MVRTCVVLALGSFAAAGALTARTSPHRSGTFTTSEECRVCHDGIRTASNEDVSFGSTWSTSMMANSARDPYFQAAVRRETADHSESAAAIEDECATCHMPMARTDAHRRGEEGSVFRYLRAGASPNHEDRLAQDGVACSLCHQIRGENFGSPQSFSGGYLIAPSESDRPRSIFGPFQIQRGMTAIMRSATGFEPTEGLHIRHSEMCATCHTLVTKARGESGDVVGELPEQMPFLEWKHSAFVAEERSCQSCHMPVVDHDVPITGVLGAPRSGVARHTFVGGNFFMQRMLGRYGADVGAQTAGQDFEKAAAITVANLRAGTSKLTLDAARADTRVVANVRVENITGHKLPTGYPSRRAWVHFVVRDSAGRIIFESGGVEARGAIAGNDHDVDALKVEPHYDEIRRSDEVQIYESVMHDRAGRPTTGLLTATGYIKDNRLLPRGFDKGSADPWIAVIGSASGDANFTGGDDRIRYVIDVGGAQGPFEIDVALRFQVIGFRWADNLRPYKAEEATRFVRYYESMASSSSEVLASARAKVP